ncbi:MAG TPA: hypothetical protein VHT75_10540 [Acidimicrobiales bacterium]|nr:hypothetical protein [Acidimicrobiales bacterium]
MDGTVTGRIFRCSGLGTPTGLSPFTGGTVVALQGNITYRQAGTDGQTIFPADVVAIQSVLPSHDFTFTLPAGNYVLRVTRYSDALPGSNATSFAAIVVDRGRTEHQDLPNLCM